jgi:DNA polymerase III epsilon subunit family exonuclease
VVELINRSPTRKTFHCYLCPERAVPADALAVHGLSAEFLADKPLFAAVADEFLAFVGDVPLVAHNAGFDIAFLNAELGSDLAARLSLAHDGRTTLIQADDMKRILADIDAHGGN